MESDPAVGRGPDPNTPGEVGRGSGDVTAAPAGSAGTSVLWLLCIFARLSSREPGPATMEADATAVGPEDGMVSGRGLAPAVGSAAGLGVASTVFSSNTLLNHCSAAFFSAATSSAVTA